MQARLQKAAAIITSSGCKSHYHVGVISVDRAHFDDVLDISPQIVWNILETISGVIWK